MNFEFKKPKAELAIKLPQLQEEEIFPYTFIMLIHQISKLSFDVLSLPQ